MVTFVTSDTCAQQTNMSQRASSGVVCVCNTPYLHVNYPSLRCNGNTDLRSVQSIALMLQYPPVKYNTHVFCVVIISTDMSMLNDMLK